MSTAIAGKKLSTRSVEPDDRQRARQSRRHPDCRVPIQIVALHLSYAGDEGGIMCHLARPEETGRALVVSLTYVRVPRSMPLARAVADYQKHRVKKIKKQ